MRGRVFSLATIAAQVCSLGEAIVAACCSFKTVSLSFMPFCFCDYFFARDSLLLNFCHFCIGVGPWCVASAYSMLTSMIISTCSTGIPLLNLIFLWIDFRNFTVRAPCSLTFACWVPIESQFVVIVAQPAPVKNCALSRVLGLCGLRGAAFWWFELLEGF